MNDDSQQHLVAMSQTHNSDVRDLYSLVRHIAIEQSELAEIAADTMVERLETEVRSLADNSNSVP